MSEPHPPCASTLCREHRDPKLNDCEDNNCPGCWTCWGEFWDPDRAAEMRERADG